jgi:hypothetical protein
MLADIEKHKQRLAVVKPSTRCSSATPTTWTSWPNESDASRRPTSISTRAEYDTWLPNSELIFDWPSRPSIATGEANTGRRPSPSHHLPAPRRRSLAARRSHPGPPLASRGCALQRCSRRVFLNQQRAHTRGTAVMEGERGEQHNNTSRCECARSRTRTEKRESDFPPFSEL